MITTTLSMISIALNIAIADMEKAKPKDSLCEMPRIEAQQILDNFEAHATNYEIQIEEYCDL